MLSSLFFLLTGLTILLWFRLFHAFHASMSIIYPFHLYPRSPSFSICFSIDILIPISLCHGFSFLKIHFLNIWSSVIEFRRWKRNTMSGSSSTSSVWIDLFFMEGSLLLSFFFLMIVNWFFPMTSFYIERCCISHVLLCSTIRFATLHSVLFLLGMFSDTHHSWNRRVFLKWKTKEVVKKEQLVLVAPHSVPSNAKQHCSCLLVLVSHPYIW